MSIPKYKTGRLLVQLGNAVSWFRNQKMQGMGLTSSQSEVIRYFLRHQDQRISAGDLMDKLGLSQSTVAGILKRLEKKSLIMRQADQTDARKSILMLTKEGMVLKQNLQEVAVQTENILLRGMTDAEQAQFNRLLQIALSNMHAYRVSAPRENGQSKEGERK